MTISRLADQKAAGAGADETRDHAEAAVFLVGAHSAIAFANDLAWEMLDEAALVRKSGGFFHAVSPKADRLLYDIFTAAARGDASIGVHGVAVPLAEPSHERWFAHVMPLKSGRREAGEANHAVAALFIRKAVPKAGPALEAIATHYTFQPGEIRVLHAIARVQGVKPLAEFLGIPEATVKTHLTKLLRKTGTKRQSELVKLVAGL